MTCKHNIGPGCSECASEDITGPTTPDEAKRAPEVTVEEIALTPQRRAIHEWIRDDAPLTIKMTITPALIDKLLDRLHALITEHVRTVLEADRKRPRKLSDWPWTDDEAAQICRHVAKLEAKLRTLTEQRDKAVEGLEDVLAHLMAANSLLSRSPKKGAPSNKMFDQMLADYRASEERGLSTLQALLEAARELVAAMDAYEADAGSEMESCWERVEAALTATRAALQETAQ